MSSDIRNRSHLIGRFFLVAELMRRGYEVSLENLKKGAEIPAKTARDIAFRVKYISTMKYGQSWLVGHVEPDDSLYYVLICTEAKSPYKSPSYWILSSYAMDSIRTEHMAVDKESKGKDMNIFPDQVVDYERKWDILPS